MKRVITLLVYLTMLVGMLSGCAGTGNETNKEVTGTEVQQVSSESVQVKEEKHDPVTLHYYVVGRAGQPDAEKVYSVVNEMIQDIYPWITVEFHVSNNADFATHVALAQASGDPIDILSSFGLTYQTEISNGTFMDITDYVDDFPALMSALPEYTYDYAKLNGRQYGVVNYQQMNANNYSFAVEKEIADKYGYDTEAVDALIQSSEFLNPEVYEHIGALLEAAWADGTELWLTYGPNTLGPQTRGYECLLEPMYIQITDESCQLINIWETQPVKDYLKALYEYKEAGFLPDDYYANRSVYNGAKGAANGYKRFIYNENNYVPNFPELRLTNWGVDLYFNQTMYSATDYYIGYNVLAGITGVGAASKYPEDALRVIELLWTNEEIYNTLTWGLEGEHYEKNADGSITTFEYNAGQAPADASYGMFYYNIGNGSLKWRNQSSTEEFENWIYNDLNKNAKKSPLIGFMPDTSRISSKVSSITSVINEYGPLLLHGGAQDWETIYEEFLTKLDAAGLDTVMEILQAQVDTFMKNK